LVLPLSLPCHSAREGRCRRDIIATQQGVADRFFKLGLIPRQIAIRDIVWRNTQT
jgi:sulfonate transport system substrate-binding protein